jgi:hypothetical protein
MTVGIAPTDGFQLIDGTFDKGVASGNNATFQTLTAHAGGTQAAAAQISANANLVYVGTVASDQDSVVLNFAIAGRWLMLANPSAHTLYVYGQVAGNKANANAVDTINGTAGSTAYQMTTGKNAIFFCAANDSD